MKIVQNSIGHIQTSAPPAMSTYSSLTDLDNNHWQDHVRTPSGATPAHRTLHLHPNLIHAYSQLATIHGSLNGPSNVKFKLA